jgi:hypothetical protein
VVEVSYIKCEASKKLYWSASPFIE